MKRCVGLFLLVSLVAVVPVIAETISNTNSYSGLSASSSGLTLPLEKFNPGLGELTKVTIELDSTTYGGSISWDNESSVMTSVTLGIGADVTATSPQSLISVTASPLQIASDEVFFDDDGAADFIGIDSFEVTGGSGSDSASGYTTNSLDTFVASYAGETFNVTVSSVVSTYLSTTGGYGPINPSFGDTDGIIIVNYEYGSPPPPLQVNIDNAVEITWNSISGVSYQVQYSTNLVDAHWVDLGSEVVGNGLTNSVFDSTRGMDRRFYRVLLK